MKLIACLSMSALVLTLSSVAGADTKSSFMYKFSNGDSYTTIGGILGQPASTGRTEKSTKSSCHFRSDSTTSSIEFSDSQGVHFQVVPLEETSDGVRTLVSITRSEISDEATVAVAVAENACTLTTGDFSGHTTRTVQTLPIGKPVAVKMQDGTTYMVTATKL